MHSLAMKKLVVLLVLGGAAFFGYRSFSGGGAVSAYEKFAEAWTHDDPAGAGKHADAETARKAFEEQSLRGLQSGAMIEAFRGTRYEIESRSRSTEGDVLLEVKQTIQFDPPGVTSAITGAMYTHIHHSARVRKTPDGWKVVAFEAKFLDMGELRKR